MIAHCDACDLASIRFHHGLTLYVGGMRYNPKRAPLARWRCSHCGGPLRAKRKGENESSLGNAVLLPAQLATSNAYRRGLLYGASHPKGKAYVPTCLRDGQQRAEYLEGVAEGRRQRQASPKRRAGDVARERKTKVRKIYFGAED